VNEAPVEREVTSCVSCPFVEKEDWSNEDDAGTDYTGCALGMPAGMPHWEAQRQIGCFGGPPAWCKLRSGPVFVKLKPEPEKPEPEDDE
jgi:hypothetical protein